MEIITCDFETYYDRDYSLSKMQTDEYVLDDRYQTIMVCLIDGDGKETVMVGAEDDLRRELQSYRDWSQVAVRCHNTLFDGFILTQRYGIKPKLWMDTLSQSRMIFPYLHSHSLANTARHMDIGEKGTTVVNMMGKRLEDMDPSDIGEYATYCVQDTRLCKQMGEHFDKFTPPLEARLIDMTIRMFTEPQLVGDIDLMRNLYDTEVARKEGLLALAKLDKSELMSANKFAARLEDLGITPPTKISPRTGKQTFAFARTDRAFTALQEHENPEVQALVAARIGAKTTIAETRALRFYEMAQRGPLPVYLSFWGAKTTGRYSGGNKVNWQNLPARGVSAGLRRALCAPEGKTVLVCDSSNIELRTVMALAGQHDAIEKLEAGVDMYCDFATQLFGKEITKADKAERFLGKTAMLGLQYGAGAPRFQEMVRQAAEHIDGVDPISLNRAQEVVNLYRGVYYNVVNLWHYCQDVVLPDIASGCSLINVDRNGWFITQRDGFGRPGEPGVVYHDLKYEDGEWNYRKGRLDTRIYGPKVVENLCQHAAMRIVMWQTARVNERYPVCLSVHDEAVMVVPDEELDEAKRYVEECFTLTPKWCRGYIPVACEYEIGRSYGDAK